MKILINLVGLSHNNLGNGMHSYTHGYSHLFDNVVNELSKNNQVDFYLKTYNTDENKNLLKVYNPIEYDFIELPDNNKNSVDNAFDTYISSVEKLRNFNYDFFIVSRYDLVIKKKIKHRFFKI